MLAFFLLISWSVLRKVSCPANGQANRIGRYCSPDHEMIWMSWCGTKIPNTSEYIQIYWEILYQRFNITWFNKVVLYLFSRPGDTPFESFCTQPVWAIRSWFQFMIWTLVLIVVLSQSSKAPESFGIQWTWEKSQHASEIIWVCLCAVIKQEKYIGWLADSWMRLQNAWPWNT
jgi:hypothetical protein